MVGIDPTESSDLCWDVDSRRCAPSQAVPQTWLGGRSCRQIQDLTIRNVNSHQMLPMFSTDGGRCRLSKPANKGVALLLSKDGDQVATFQEQEGTIGEDLPAQRRTDC